MNTTLAGTFVQETPGTGPTWHVVADEQAARPLHERRLS